MRSINIYKDGVLVRTIELDPEITYIGRMAENHITIDDPKVSRSHAKILHAAGVYILEDQHSENGTFMSGKRVKAQELHLQDQFTVGSFTLEMVETTHAESINREHQIADESEQDWRIDQTVNIASPELVAQLLSGEKDLNQKNTLATVNFALELGDKKYEHDLSFVRAFEQAQSDEEDKVVEIRVKYNGKILYKKFTLED